MVSMWDYSLLALPSDQATKLGTPLSPQKGPSKENAPTTSNEIKPPEKSSNPENPLEANDNSRPMEVVESGKPDLGNKIVWESGSSGNKEDSSVRMETDQSAPDDSTRDVTNQNKPPSGPALPEQFPHIASSRTASNLTDMM